VSKHGVTEFLALFADVGTTFFDIESDLLIVLDGQGGIERVNPAFERTLDRIESEVLRVPIIQLIDANDWAKFIRGFTEIHPEAVRMLRKGNGDVLVRLVACRFKGGRGFIVLRKVMG